jgi:hypothetical protein
MGCTSGAEKFRSSARKDFFDSIDPNRKPRLLVMAVISPPQQRLAARKSTGGV